jgi:hypothetical protein
MLYCAHIYESYVLRIIIVTHGAWMNEIRILSMEYKDGLEKYEKVV